MRKLFILSATLFLISCSKGDHSHDGKYKASVFNASMTWVTNEEVKLDGNVMYFRSTSIGDNSTISEYKTSCEQFPDRVEFKGKDGLTLVGRFDKDENLKYGEYTYKKVLEENGKVNTPDKKSSSQKNEQEVSVTNTNEPKTQGTFFIGTKSFCSQEREDECIEITIKENGDISFSDPTDGASKLTTGHIEGATIVDANGKDLFIKYKPFHLYMKKGVRWVDFNELTGQ